MPVEIAVRVQIPQSGGCGGPVRRVWYSPPCGVLLSHHPTANAVSTQRVLADNGRTATPIETRTHQNVGRRVVSAAGRRV